MSLTNTRGHTKKALSEGSEARRRPGHRLCVRVGGQAQDARRVAAQHRWGGVLLPAVPEDDAVVPAARGEECPQVLTPTSH